VIWYFAYGSNLSIEQMVARIGPLPPTPLPRIVRLLGYRLAFDMLGSDGRQYANIVAPGEFVLGVVYPVSLAAMQRLDRFENGYYRSQVNVVDVDGVSIDAVAYRAEPKNVRIIGNPNPEYVQTILRGCRQYGLPDAYIRGIETLANTSAAR
jgi:gamma-glutamylcyclotransferase (GGCT)/AIG2-like uncharacterized protein YtfP